MKNILVTIDFSKNEKQLIDKAFQLAESFNSKLWLMHIAAPDPDFVGYEVGPQYIRDARASELREEHMKLKEYSTALKRKGVVSEGLLVQGATIEMIIEESKKLNIDLIIAGHHKHGFFYNAFVGSVSAELIKKSKIPVLIVPLE
ncbi:universal stress protein [Cyclobacterium amurskyense]|uniref:Universal stress protein n=1 Tax=Cyclobacterium amurskyense TaxID=320787 RepID=A0A0H4PG78_9BACT|nr:universal stress protein [Cyclobacterium amurskyense]AKP51838.1 Universal stress protein [Cyclobacterium amurskyense]|tara:strand:+ start:12699 stop:13133 length:435 start_codon:yes stop_codon:yes gene_type:complete